MKIDVKELQTFFEAWATGNETSETATMPKAVRELAWQGHHFNYGEVRVRHMEAQYLDPELRKSREFQSPAENVPILYLGAGNYVASDPDNGKRLGDPTKVYNTETVGQ